MLGNRIISVSNSENVFNESVKKDQYQIGKW